MHDFTIGLAFVFDLLKLFLILPNIKKKLGRCLSSAFSS